MKTKMLIACAVLLTTIQCGRNMGIVRNSLAKQPKIGVVIGQPTKLWIRGQKDRQTGRGYVDEFRAAKTDAPKELEAIGKDAAQEIKKQFSGYNMTIVDSKKIPMKNETFMGVTQQVPDYAALGYDLIFKISPGIAYSESDPNFGAGPFEYKIVGEILVTFFEKQADGTMKWILPTMTGRYEMGTVTQEIGNKFSDIQTVESLAAKHPAGVVVPALKATIVPGVAKMKEELEKKE